ncbi:MAG: glycosyltransferase family 4 protein, partial [Candidatus Omnitrophica bacterium]|nr:glycosyltransferase family 4 protein [Candidatus Omnitrophota bacterium]
GVFEGLRVIPTKDVALPARLKELSVDVVRAYGGAWPADMACAYRYGAVPVVVSLHDRRPETAHDMLRFADVVLGVSEDTCALARKRGVLPKRVWLRPNGVDTEMMRPLADAPLPLELRTTSCARYVLHVGRLSPEKNLDTLIDALAFLPADTGLVVIGPGDNAPYRARAEKAGLASRVVFTGGVSNGNLPAYYNAAAVVCQPSHTEAMSNVVLEAMACGRPLVVSAAAAKGVGISDGVEACVLADLSVPALVSALRSVLEDGPLCQALGSRARAAVMRYEVKDMARQEAAQYARILEMKAAGVFRRGMLFQWSVLMARLWGRVQRKICHE